MFCGHCGENLEDGLQFCVKCGRAVGKKQPSNEKVNVDCPTVNQQPETILHKETINRNLFEREIRKNVYIEIGMWILLLVTFFVAFLGSGYKNFDLYITASGKWFLIAAVMFLVVDIILRIRMGKIKDFLRQRIEQAITVTSDQIYGYDMNNRNFRFSLNEIEKAIIIPSTESQRIRDIIADNLYIKMKNGTVLSFNALENADIIARKINTNKAK